MIISVRDSQNITSDSASTVALLASMTAISKSKKTLVIQVTPSTDDSVLNILAGKAIRENSIKEIYSYADEGLDSLLMRAETAELAKEQYDECITPLLEKENMLDILKPSKKVDFREVYSIELLDNVLANTKDIYDYVFILIPNNDKEILEFITERTDEDLVVIPQGKSEKVDLSNKKTYLVVKFFESESRFDVASIKKKYGIKKVYTIPHNVAYRDSVLSETVLDFVLANKKNIKDDNNFYFMDSLKTLIDRYVLDKDDDEEEAEKPKMKHKKEVSILMADDKQELPDDAIQEVTVKTGLFRKKKKIMINL